MTQPERRPPAAADPDPERVLAQALSAMAGGGKQARAESSTDVGRTPLTRLQIMLIATIAGLLVGITAGLISILL